MESFGRELRKLREEKGLSLKQLSKLSDVSYVAISYIECEKKKPRMLTVAKLSKSLNCDFKIVRNKKELNYLLKRKKKEENKYAN